MSDLHLEFADIELPGGDVLILAGDIWLTRWLREPDGMVGAEKHERFKGFARVEMAKYQRVLMVTGNHEPYGDNIDEMDDVIREFLSEYAPNARLLSNEVEEIDGIAFLGTPLWATCGVGRSIKERAIWGGMNDFKLIRTGKPSQTDRVTRKGIHRTFSPFDANELHETAVAWLDHGLPKHERCVVIGHHAPSLRSANGHRFGTEHLDLAYCSNQHALIKANPQIAMWIHGHTHKEERYTVGQTKIVANPRGYFPDERCSRNFDPCAADFDTQDILMERAA